MNVRECAGRHGGGPEESSESPVDEPVVLFGRPPELEVFDDVRYPGMSGAAAGNRVALTFDDGPDRWTELILDALDQEDVHATFFVVGQKVEDAPAVTREIVSRGHEVANHTFSHANLAALSNQEIVTELADCSLAIQNATGRTPYFYRAPFLNDTPAAKMAGLALGMLSVSCDVIAEDWALKDWRQITNRVTSGVKHGGRIVLLHDGVPHDRNGIRTPTYLAVKTIVPWLKEHGYELVTVSELLGRVGACSSSSAFGSTD